MNDHEFSEGQEAIIRQVGFACAEKIGEEVARNLKVHFDNAILHHQQECPLPAIADEAKRTADAAAAKVQSAQDQATGAWYATRAFKWGLAAVLAIVVFLLNHWSRAVDIAEAMAKVQQR